MGQAPGAPGTVGSMESLVEALGTTDFTTESRSDHSQESRESARKGRCLLLGDSQCLECTGRSWARKVAFLAGREPQEARVPSKGRL